MDKKVIQKIIEDQIKELVTYKATKAKFLETKELIAVHAQLTSCIRDYMDYFYRC